MTIKKILTSSTMILLVLSACNLKGEWEGGTPGVGDGMLTSVALTVEMNQTQRVGEATLTPEVQPQTSDTPLPLDIEDLPEVVTNTPEGADDPGDIDEDAPCDFAEFVSETVEDGTIFAPGETFTKTWVVRNSGTCTWTSGYDLVFIEGDSMDGPASQELTAGSISQGQEVVIQLQLIAPEVEGSFRGDWKLRNASGVIFGVPDDYTLWVDIVVQE
ncbi:MAG: hypothetical protein JXA19_04760 [Anaerolineales bacterium]|nr:hypothetical protein [Anaerolineales bacterium]